MYVCVHGSMGVCQSGYRGEGHTLALLMLIDGLAVSADVRRELEASSAFRLLQRQSHHEVAPIIVPVALAVLRHVHHIEALKLVSIRVQLSGM